ncbi:MAG: hypothetical protein KIT57_10375 [Blastocatellales bacterium]|nr:hypothetical protein [Blastocatellales bacterium]
MKIDDCVIIASPQQQIAASGMRLRSILSASLYLEQLGNSGPINRHASAIVDACHDRWTDLAHAVAALPDSAELLLIVSSQPNAESGVHDVDIGFVTLGRGATAEAAMDDCRRSCGEVSGLVRTILDYAEIERIEESRVLRRLCDHLAGEFTHEIRRRMERLRVNHGIIEGETLGFEGKRRRKGALDALHLFPWTPSDDPWRRLLETLVAEKGRAALIVHVRGMNRAPASCLEAARTALLEIEKLVTSSQDETMLWRQTEVLREQALQRLAILEGRVIAARIFVASEYPPSAALLSTIEGCLDDASVRSEQGGADLMFCGGASWSEPASGDILAPLDKPSLDQIFGLREASAILRTPMPVGYDMPGIRSNRARTARITGRSGEDAPIGVNIHRGERVRLSLDAGMRFRHTYIIGQTGTGKSTLLLNMILHDIRAGRGVGVIDPHGTLIDQILEHYPRERAEDLVIVDVTDVERPVGFNILKIDEPDSLQYRFARDLVIDDLFSYLARTYDPQMMGPIFETHFRGMFSLLLGVEPQCPPLIPNLLIFRSLYTNRDLRRALVDRTEGQDLMLDDFIREVAAATGEQHLANMSQYITSKFTRFYADLSLRNITCQNRILDLDQIVNQGRVLLFYIGKGRFGDHAAGLLASMLVFRLRHIVMKRGAGGAARPYYLYVDEFQLVADERFTELLAEARKFKLALTLAHQYARQIPEKILDGVLGNVGTLIAFRVGAQDGELLAPVFAPTFGGEDLNSLPNFRAYAQSFGVLGETPFSIDTDPAPPGGDPQFASTLRGTVRQRYGRPREEVEAEIASTLKEYRSLPLPERGLESE